MLANPKCLVMELNLPVAVFALSLPTALSFQLELILQEVKNAPLPRDL